jgi:hypothetical protein
VLFANDAAVLRARARRRLRSSRLAASRVSNCLRPSDQPPRIHQYFARPNVRENRSQSSAITRVSTAISVRLAEADTGSRSDRPSARRSPTRLSGAPRVWTFRLFVLTALRAERSSDQLGVRGTEDEVPHDGRLDPLGVRRRVLLLALCRSFLVPQGGPDANRRDRYALIALEARSQVILLQEELDVNSAPLRRPTSN